MLIDPDEILNEASLFYENLYTSKCITRNIKSYFNDITTESDVAEGERSDCEGLLTEEECKTAVFSMANNKSPGSDGLPVDFYKTFWDLLAPFVVNSLNAGYKNSCLSDEQSKAIISLIPKPSKDLNFIKKIGDQSLF